MSSDIYYICETSNYFRAGDDIVGFRCCFNQSMKHIHEFSTNGLILYFNERAYLYLFIDTKFSQHTTSAFEILRICQLCFLFDYTYLTSALDFVFLNFLTSRYKSTTSAHLINLFAP